mmetsp:Transcript_36077/g.112757  ORF Transcript_36077/g.112757 Transcript_36077/m.112757 type:complete len:163 (-) Transcript_36077:96-584(-)
MQCAGATTLSRCLSGHQAVCKLELAGNQIGSAGGKEIFAVLSSMQALTHLNLHNNNLRDDGMQHLLAFFPKSCLKFLDVSMNQISPVTDRELAKLFFTGRYDRNDAGRTCWYPAKILFVLAILMSRHPRLGCKSAFNELHEDVFQIIIDDFLSSFNDFSVIF